MTGIKAQKDLLAFIKREKNTLQQLQTDPKYGTIYRFNANAT